MKAAFAISTVLNLVLAGGLVFVLTRQNQEAGKPLPITRVADRPSRPMIASVPIEVRPVETKPFRWSQLESADYRTYVQNLRNSGCPEPTVRAIVTADVDAVYRHDSGEIERKLADLASGSLADQMKSYDEQQALKVRLQKMPAEENSEIAYLLGLTPSTTQAAMGTANTSSPTSGVTQASITSTSSEATTADAATVPSSNPPAADAPATLASSFTYDVGGQVVPVQYPVVFQKVDPSSLNLNSDQVQAIQNLQQNFVDNIGGPNQDPNNPAYLIRWRQAQLEADNALRFILGWSGFSSYQMLAQQGKSSGAAVRTP